MKIGPKLNSRLSNAKLEIGFNPTVNSGVNAHKKEEREKTERKVAEG